MKGFHGLLGECTTLLVILSLFATALPRSIHADDLKKAKLLNDEAGAEKQIEFKGAKSFYGNLSDAIGKTYEAGHFWPVIIGSIVPTIMYYYQKQRRVSDYIDVRIKSLKDTNGTTMLVARMAQNRNDTAKRLQELLKGASKADFDRARQLLPEEVIKKIDASPVKSGVAATTSYDDLIRGVNELHAVNKGEYEVWKEFAPELEKALDLPEGSLATKLVDPDDYMMQGHKLASKTHNPRAFAAELKSFQGAIEREAFEAKYFGVMPKLPANAPVWWKPSWKSALSAVGLALPQTKLGMWVRNSLIKGFKVTAPALVMVGLPMLAMVYVEYSVIKAEEKRRETELLDQLKDVRNIDHEKYAFSLVQDSLLLSAELAWQEIRDRYPDEPFAKEDSHFRPGDPIGRAWVEQAWTNAGITMFGENQNPFDRNTKEDQAADKLVADLSTKLNMEVPEKANKLSSRFFKIFWLELIAKATEMPGGESLKNMADSRNLLIERQGFAERPPLTKQELAHDLSIYTPYALFFASYLIRAEREVNELWIKLEPEKLEKILKVMDEIEPGLAKHYREIIAKRKAKKESSERGERDLLPLDPDDETPSPAPAEAQPMEQPPTDKKAD